MKMVQCINLYLKKKVKLKPIYISHAMRHELNFAFMPLTSLIVAKFAAHPWMDVEEPNQNDEQEQCEFAFLGSLFFSAKNKLL